MPPSFPDIYDLITFEAGFKTLMNRHGINFVFVGILDDFLASLNKEATYPCLYVERPTENSDFDGNIQFQTRLFYLQKGVNLLEADKKTTYNQCRTRLREILLYLKNEGKIKANQSFNIDYKDSYMGDGLIGAFAEIELIGDGFDYVNCN